MKKMVAEAHRLDSSRLTTAGVNAWGSNVDFGFSQEIDVMGFNYSLGFIDEYHKNHPKQPIIGTETSNATVTRGVYSISEDKNAVVVSDGVGGYYMPDITSVSESDKARNHIPSNMITSNKGAYDSFKFHAEHKYLAGSFFWTGFDYKGETWPSPVPNNSSQFGALDLAGFPKAMCYYYKSWRQDKPVLHIAQHWNYKGMEGTKIQVLIHTNCDEVKLVLNKRKIGTQKIERYGYAVWQVPYQSGTLTAIGYKNGKEVLREKIETTGVAYKLSLSSNCTKLSANGEDVIIVNVEVKDKKGRTLPLADNLITFSLDGDAQILGCGNGYPSSTELDTASSRKAFNGKAMVIIRSGVQSGMINVKATAIGLLDAELSLTVN